HRLPAGDQGVGPAGGGVHRCLQQEQMNTSTTPDAPVLQLTGIDKQFNGVPALRGVALRLRAGEIHALLGQNGAGKSTLIKVLTGVYAADAGEMTLAGNPIRPSSPIDAQRMGISTVYQEVNLCPNLSV